MKSKLINLLENNLGEYLYEHIIGKYFTKDSENTNH